MADTTTARTPDAIALLLRQHELARELMNQLSSCPADERDELFRPLVRLLAVHETAEEMAVYPALRRLGPEGQRLADARLAEEDQAKKDLAGLETLGVDDPMFISSFLMLREAVERHAQAEEREVFPMLAERMSVDELDAMGRRISMAESVAPTHAHRAAPESNIGNMVTGPMVSIIDRVRDALASR